MNSADVARALKASVFPVLREADFSEFKSRTAWRDRPGTIAVMDFRSLGSYLGSAVGATSHSFGATVGLYYKAVHAAPWATDAVPDRPEESRCHARKVLRKRIFQLWLLRPDVWYVNARGTNLDAVIADAIAAVRSQALPWLDEMSDPGRALEALESRRERDMRRGIAHEMLGGGLNSFARAEVASALALALGDHERARRAWERMLANPYYKGPGELRTTAEQRLLKLSLV